MTPEEKDKFKSDIVDTVRDVMTMSHSVAVKNYSTTGADIAVIREHIKNINEKIKNIDDENTTRNGSFSKAVDNINKAIETISSSEEKLETKISMATKIVAAILTFIFLPVLSWIILSVIEISKTLAAINH
jgi:predicted  nucleic acid-binding Zn-ribbon protein